MNRYIRQPALPQDTFRVIADRRDTVTNFGLAYFKFADYADRQEKNRDGVWVTKETKFFHWREIAETPYPAQWAVTSYFNDILNSYQSRLASILECYPKSEKVEIQTARGSALALGMGIDSVYENGFTFHPVYGVPYIPSSALKGLARRAYIERFCNNNEQFALESDPAFCDLFGCTGRTRLVSTDDKGLPQYDGQGNLIYIEVQSWYFEKEKQSGKPSPLGDRIGSLVFFDALPRVTDGAPSAFTLNTDIVNPHYAPYYENALPPADIYNPRPSNFLVVSDATFVIGIALSRVDPDGRFVQKLQDVKDALLQALKEDGIGGKTTVGYGRFVEAGTERPLSAPTTPGGTAGSGPIIVVKDLESTTWKRAGELVAKKKAYIVDAMVTAARVDNGRGHYKFQPMVEELRGQLTRELYIQMLLKEGDVISLELTGVNWAKKIFAVDGKSVRPKR